MFKLLALDQSITQTGVAIYDGGPAHRIECYSFASTEKGDDWLTKVDKFGRSMRKLISAQRPSFIVFEKPMLYVQAYGRKPSRDLAGFAGDEVSSVNANQLLLPAICGQIIQAAICYSIPYEWVAPATWRKVYKGMAKADVKQMARDYCKLNGISFSNHNEAEAAAIAVWGYAHSQPFKQLRYAPEAING